MRAAFFLCVCVCVYVHDIELSNSFILRVMQSVHLRMSSTVTILDLQSDRRHRVDFSYNVRARQDYSVMLCV